MFSKHLGSFEFPSSSGVLHKHVICIQLGQKRNWTTAMFSAGDDSGHPVSVNALIKHLLWGCLLLLGARDKNIEIF